MWETGPLESKHQFQAILCTHGRDQCAFHRHTVDGRQTQPCSISWGDQGCLSCRRGMRLAEESAVWWTLCWLGDWGSKSTQTNQGGRGCTSTCCTTPTQLRVNLSLWPVSSLSLLGGFFRILWGSWRGSCFVPWTWWLCELGSLSRPWLQPWETLVARTPCSAPSSLQSLHSAPLRGVAFATSLLLPELICSLPLQSSYTWRLCSGTAGGRWCVCGGEAVPRHKLSETFGRASWQPRPTTQEFSFLAKPLLHFWGVLLSLSPGWADTKCSFFASFQVRGSLVASCPGPERSATQPNREPWSLPVWNTPTCCITS